MVIINSAKKIFKYVTIILDLPTYTYSPEYHFVYRVP